MDNRTWIKKIEYVIFSEAATASMQRYCEGVLNLARKSRNFPSDSQKHFVQKFYEYCQRHELTEVEQMARKGLAV